MLDPKYGYDILIILMDEGIPLSPLEQLLWLEAACEFGDSAPARLYQGMPSLKAVILAESGICPLGPCPTEKTVISVGEPMRFILN